MRRLCNGLLLIGLLMQANFISADIFRYEDEKGNISFSDQSSTNATLVKPPEKTYRYKHQVKRVYDGDTIILKNGDRVRLLGINTPEIESRHRQGEEGGLTAKQWLKDKLQHGSVFLEYDVEKKDKYDRSLAHLFSIEGEHLNKELVQAGLATLSIIPPNLRYLDELKKAEQSALKHGFGIWSLDSYKPISIDELSITRKKSGWQRFLVTATKVKLTRKYVRLILSDKVDIRIPKVNLALFPDLDSYLNKSLEIRGWASRTKDRYSILIRHPSAIILL
ncbi:MAG: thermonuclease family protein [Gammaproteobacteria bacterium]|nr:thermonuclease family protein [Gammaproteobacteria bacterium]